MVKPYLPIDIYYHVSDHPHWDELVRDKIQRLKDSGLWAQFRTLRFQTCYDAQSFENFHSVLGLDPQDPRIFQIHLKDSHRPLGECYSMIDLSEQVRLANQGPSHAVLRISTKGLTHRLDPGSWPQAQAWNEYYDYWLIDQWQLCHSALVAGHDCAGANWHPWGEPKGHFSGTQFWAHSRYISQLRALKPPHAVAFQQQLPAYSPRHDAEVWIGQASPRILELHHWHHAVVYDVETPQNYRLPWDQSL